MSKMRAIAGITGMAVVSTSFAAFTAYNDCSWGTAPSGNVTGYRVGLNGGTPVDNTSGLLKNYASGVFTGITASLTFATSSISYTYTNGAASGAGDEATYFGGIVDLVGLPSYATGFEATWWVDVTFTGLDPLKTYEFVTTANRNNNTYTTRYSKITLQGADLFTNGSSAGTTVLDAGASTVFCTGYNPNGYVARWNEIKAGADGTFVVHFGVWDTTQSGGRGYGPSAFMLKETDAVPEPATLVVLGLGAVALMRRRRK